MNNEKDFITVAVRSIVKWFNCQQDLVSKYHMIDNTNVFMVWYCKALQNWKGLFGTNLPGDGLYYEFTWNGDKAEGYLDVYEKRKNVVVIDKRAEEGVIK